jgi:hypothetical protein
MAELSMKRGNSTAGPQLKKLAIASNKSQLGSTFTLVKDPNSAVRDSAEASGPGSAG